MGPTGSAGPFRHSGGIGVAQPLLHRTAAKVLANKDALAAAKLYRALTLRIVNSGKSKYYREALGHFENGRTRGTSIMQLDTPGMAVLGRNGANGQFAKIGLSFSIRTDRLGQNRTPLPAPGRPKHVGNG